MDDVQKNRPELIAFEKWLAAIGRSSVTGWRWRKQGWIETVTISGRPYVRSSAIDKFLARAQRGDFAGVVKVPLRPHLPATDAHEPKSIAPKLASDSVL